MNPVLLSVVVPVYAVEGYLHQCLESLRAGLTPGESASVEVIAVDDASPDSCGAMLDDYAARHGDLRVVHLSSNVGLGLARNAGLAEARGDYVWFVDSDDWLPAGAMRAVLAKLRAERPDVLLIDHLRAHEDGRLEPDASSGVLKDPRLPSLLRLQHTAWNRIVRRGHLREIDLRFQPGWYEDVPFSNPVLIAARTVGVLDEVCYHYRVGRAGAITATRSERHFEAFDQYDRMLAWVGHREPEPWLRNLLFTLMVNHLLVVLGNAGRLHPRHRRAYFRRLARHYRRHLPAGYDGSPGIKHRLVQLNNYALYAGLRQAYRMTRRDPEPSPAVRPALASATQQAQAASIR
ncbi:glycosyltransferase family 2 protein [Symbioplanes lichenis]|uniref:glycosyltransferase family 2 protein n=1 Tax=Symbioplanes lichenis TaxID=1629072 RepID=UPI00273A45A9|nr:glycosyltransferase [Actinoplanes lichenis]